MAKGPQCGRKTTLWQLGRGIEVEDAWLYISFGRITRWPHP